MGCEERHGRCADPEGPGDVGRPVLSAELELGGRRSLAFDRPQARQPELRSRDLGDQRRLVVAAMPFPLGMHRDGNDQRGTDTHPMPPPSDRQPERSRQPSFAAVFQVVQGGTDWPGEWCAPLDLEEWGGEIDRHTNRDASWQVQASIKGTCAPPAQRLALAAAARARTRQREIERPGGG